MADDNDYAYHPPSADSKVTTFIPKRRAEDRRNLPRVATPEEFAERLRRNPTLNPRGER